MASRTVAGTVSHFGSPALVDPAQLFTVTRTSPGQYEVFFGAVFIKIFAVVATQVSGFPTGDTRDNAVVVDFDESKFRVITGKSDGKLENRSFSFIAIGD